jgi:glyoxylase I family protein
MAEFVSNVLGIPQRHVEGVEADLFKLPDGSSFAVASPGLPDRDRRVCGVPRRR